MARSRSPAQTQINPMPFITPEAQESHLISLAYSLVEQRLLDGTASSQETTHFLNRGSGVERLKIEKLEAENALLRAKTEQLESQKNQAEIYEEALNAFRRYSGQTVEEDYYDDENDY